MKKLLLLVVGFIFLFASVSYVSAATLTNNCVDGCGKGSLVLVTGSLSTNYQYDIYVIRTSDSEEMWDPLGGHNTGSSTVFSHTVFTANWFFFPWPAGDYTIILTNEEGTSHLATSHFLLTEPQPKPKPLPRTKYPTEK
jgi:hypothetical protein